MSQALQLLLQPRHERRYGGEQRRRIGLCRIQQANALVERLQDAAETDPVPLFTAVAAFVARLQQQLQRLAH